MKKLEVFYNNKKATFLVNLFLKSITGQLCMLNKITVHLPSFPCFGIGWKTRRIVTWNVFKWG